MFCRFWTELWLRNENAAWSDADWSCEAELKPHLWLPSVTVGTMEMFSSGAKEGRREPYQVLTSVSLWNPEHTRTRQQRWRKGGLRNEGFGRLFVPDGCCNNAAASVLLWETLSLQPE